ncbi:MAG TPA: hypothetical protein VGJ86_15770 [Acidimicrobiales bacterium]
MIPPAPLLQRQDIPLERPGTRAHRSTGATRTIGLDRPIGSRPQTGPTPPIRLDHGGGRSRIPVLVVALALLMGAAAAVVVAGAVRDDGGNGPGPTEMSQKQQFTNHISGYVFDTGVGSIDQTQANCLADQLVTTLGVDHLAELDILHSLDVGRGTEGRLSSILSGPEAQEAYHSAFECLDDASLVGFMARSFPPESEIGPERAQCMVQGWLDGMGRDPLIAMYTTFATQGLAADMSAVITPEQQDVVIGVAGGCTDPPSPAPTP